MNPLPPDRGRCVELFGVSFDAVTLEQATERLLTLARRQDGAPHLVFTPNVDHVVRGRHDSEFIELCATGSLVIADGKPLVWASRLLGKDLPERVAGSDLMPRSAVEAARRGLRYYFLGGTPGDAERAAAVIAAEAGSDGLCGIDCPPFGFENDADYVEAMVERINRADPDLLYIGLGSPKQERLMMQLRPLVRARAIMAVGVTFSFVAGTVRRAPRWMQRCGLEWLWRLVCEPRRLWRRYANNLVVFPCMVAAAWWRRRSSTETSR